MSAADLVPYEVVVLAYLAGEPADVTPGAGLWTAVEFLKGRGFVALVKKDDGLAYVITDAGRAALDRIKGLAHACTTSADETAPDSGDASG